MFHIIHRAHPQLWDALAALVREVGSGYICSTFRPDDFPAERWCEKLSALSIKPAPADAMAAGETLAQSIHTALSERRAGFLMLDELNVRSTEAVAACARVMAARHPEHSGRWGAFLVHGTSVAYPNLNRTGAIDALLKAGAHVSVEIYPRCSMALRQPAPDDWLAAFLRGEAVGGSVFPKRFLWLMDRRRELNSSSTFSLLTGVTNSYLDVPEQRVSFLERCLRVWSGQPGLGELFRRDRGGFGSYKWDNNPGGVDRVTDPELDTAFVELWKRTCK